MEPFVHDAVLDMQLSRQRLEDTLDGLDERDWERYVPFGSRTIRELLEHLAGADQRWAIAAQGLLKGEGEGAERATGTTAARAQRRKQTNAELREEMNRRRGLLRTLFDLLERKHLAQRLPAFAPHDSVRERIWVGYHDRLHQADIERALRMNWYPQDIVHLPEIAPAAASLDPGAMLYVIYSVDESYWERPSPLEGWSYRGLLAHIATGDWVLQYQLRHVIEHGSVVTWPDVTAGNAERVEERRFTTWQTLTDEFLSMRHETMRLLAEVKPPHLKLALERPWLPVDQRSATVFDYLRDFWWHDDSHRNQLRNAMRHKTSPRA
jgi:hypothetical protein